MVRSFTPPIQVTTYLCCTIPKHQFPSSRPVFLTILTEPQLPHTMDCVDIEGQQNEQVDLPRAGTFLPLSYHCPLGKKC